MMAAYRRVGPRHRELYLYLHLHFVAPAKHHHPKSPTNPPPSGGTPFEGDPRWNRGAAWHHLLRRGARWQSGGGRPPCLTVPVPAPPHPNPLSVLWIAPLLPPVPPLHITSPCAPQNPHDNFEELKGPSELRFMNSRRSHGNRMQLCI